jgi:hypothetical protein
MLFKFVFSAQAVDASNAQSSTGTSNVVEVVSKNAILIDT